MPEIKLASIKKIELVKEENMLKKLKTAVSAKMPDMRSKKGMELVQVGILIAIAIAVGIIFKTQIQSFVNDTFSGLLVEKFQ